MNMHVDSLSHVYSLSWPDPGIRALEFSLAAISGFSALVLRSGRRPSFPSLPRHIRTDPLAIPWTTQQFQRPRVLEAGWALLGGLAMAVFVGGSGAVPAGLLGAIGTLVWLNRRRAKARLREKARLHAQVPPLADLFAAGLAAGLQPVQAASTVGHAFGRNGFAVDTRLSAKPSARAGAGTGATDRSDLSGTELLACRFHDAAEAVLAGADAESAWSALAHDEATAPLAAAVIRSSRTGAPAAATVGRAAHELREAAADALAAEVRTIGVRATAPLVLCFLPAFVLLGVLPTALGLLPRLRA